MKTSELIGPALDWAVAKALGIRLREGDGRYKGQVILADIQDQQLFGKWVFDPSTNWAQGGPIIDREKIWLKFPFGEAGDIEAIHGFFGFPNIVSAKGPTALIAAMRCYIASRLGDEIDIPNELK